MADEERTEQEDIGPAVDRFVALDKTGKPSAFYSTDIWQKAKMPPGVMHISETTYLLLREDKTLRYVSGKWVSA